MQEEADVSTYPQHLGDGLGADWTEAMVAHGQLLVADVAGKVGDGHDSESLAGLPVDQTVTM